MAGGGMIGALVVLIAPTEVEYGPARCQWSTVLTILLCALWPIRRSSGMTSSRNTPVIGIAR